MTAQPDTRLTVLVHVLRQTAAFVERTGVPELAIYVSGDRVSIQVPASAGCLDDRIAAVARLVRAAGTATGPSASGSFIGADTQIAGHRAHIFTPLPRQAP
jgi:hypothetical protein